MVELVFVGPLGKLIVVCIKQIYVYRGRTAYAAYVGTHDPSVLADAGYECLGPL
jgi:hypothetical protein